MSIPLRPLGRSGLRVSEIGFGAWGIGGRTAGATSYGDTDDDTSRAALARALEVGVRFWDTAPAYGDGHSETLIGESLRGRRDDVVLATKVGQPRFGVQDLSPDAILRQVDGSLERLRTDHVDVVQVHGCTVAEIGSAPDLMRALRRVVDDGTARALGISLASPADGVLALDTIAGEIPLAAFQVNLNLLDVRAVRCGLLERAARAGVGIIARTPLCFGFLSGAVSPDGPFPPGDHRASWPLEQRRRWADAASALGRALDGAGGNRAQLALRWCISQPAVATVIPGLVSVAEVDEAAQVAAWGALTDRHLAAVEQVRALSLDGDVPVLRTSGSALATPA